jgi:hypothetical protein
MLPRRRLPLPRFLPRTTFSRGKLGRRPAKQRSGLPAILSSVRPCRIDNRLCLRDYPLARACTSRLLSSLESARKATSNTLFSGEAQETISWITRPKKPSNISDSSPPDPRPGVRYHCIGGRRPDRSTFRPRPRGCCLPRLSVGIYRTRRGRGIAWDVSKKGDRPVGTA